MNMILITTALMIEAQPLKAALNLSLVGGQPFPVFKNEEVILIVTGTGSHRAAAATGWALGRYQAIKIALNVGFAGALEEVAELHQWYGIHSIRDKNTDRLLVPDRLWDLQFPEKALLTVGKPVTGLIAWDGLVDMEGSGFYEAARQVLSPDKIYLLKWISDYLTGKIDVKETGVQFSTAANGLLPAIQNLIELGREESGDDRVFLDELKSRIRLTETQWQFLAKWVDGYLKRGGESQAILDILPIDPPAKKPDNNRLLEEIKNVLKG
jgi:hypothetical protein